MEPSCTKPPNRRRGTGELSPTEAETEGALTGIRSPDRPADQSGVLGRRRPRGVTEAGRTRSRQLGGAIDGRSRAPAGTPVAIRKFDALA